MTIPNAYQTSFAWLKGPGRHQSWPQIRSPYHVAWIVALVALFSLAFLLLATACVSSGFIDATWDLSLKPVHAVWTTQPAS